MISISPKNRRAQGYGDRVFLIWSSIYKGEKRGKPAIPLWTRAEGGRKRLTERAEMTGQQRVMGTVTRTDYHSPGGVNAGPTSLEACEPQATGKAATRLQPKGTQPCGEDGTQNCCS